VGNPIFLLGAGASIDAGLSDTNTLTRKIYDILTKDSYDKAPSKVYGYVIAKILAKKVREGGSPFEPVNVEEVYAGIESIINRDANIASEFVSNWDPVLDRLMPSFDERKFERALSEMYELGNRGWEGTVSIKAKRSNLRDVIDELTKIASRSGPAGATHILTQLIGALTVCLRHDRSKTAYIEDIIKIAHKNGAVFGSLNYDLVVEDALGTLGISYDYGLDDWSEKKLVQFRRMKSTTRILKMHGSMNWFEEGENIKVEEPKFEYTEQPSWHRGPLPQMIFGDANSKLRPDGPFLQLRHEFEKSLLSTNVLVIIGYAFADTHLNAIIRRWTSTRRKAKMIVVDPSTDPHWMSQIGTPYFSSSKLERKTVDIAHIRKPASNAVTDIENELNRPIDLSIPKDLSGYLPHILIRVI
jgi:SIR2-like domain